MTDEELANYLKNLKEEVELKKESIKLTQEMKQSTSDYVQALKDLNEEKAKGSAADQTKIDLHQAKIDNYEDLGRKLDGVTEKLRNHADAQNLAKAQGKGLADSITSLIGVTTDYEKSLIGSISAVFKGIDATGEHGAATKEFTETLTKNFTKLNIGISILNKVAETTGLLVFATDSALVSFNRSTGAASTYRDNIISLNNSLFLSGVTMQDAADAQASMVTNITDFNKMSPTSQDNLLKTTSLLAEMGVSLDTSTSNFQFMTKSMGISGPAAEQSLRDLFTLATDLKMPPQEVAANFAAAQPYLSAFGKSGTTVFKDMQIASRESGIAVDRFISIIEKFDTFEGAAESAGKLNALLGGPFLNSMEMVMATDPTERMRMLSDGLNSAGQSFDDMTYYQRKSIAAAAGLKDVNELALVMSGSFESLGEEVALSAAEIEDLAEQQKKFSDIKQDLTELAMSFAIAAEPLLGVIKSIIGAMESAISKVNKWTEEWSGFSRGFGLIATSIASVLTLVGMMGGTFGAAAAAAAAAIGAVVPAIAGAGAALGGAALGFASFALGVLAVATALFFVAAAIGNIASGFSLMALSLHSAKLSISELTGLLSGDSATTALTNLKGLTSEMESFAAAASKLDKIQNLKALTSMTLRPVATTTPSAVAAIPTQDNLIARATATIQTQNQATKGVGELAKKEAQPMQINVAVQLDGRTLGESVVKLMSDRSRDDRTSKLTTGP